MKIRVNISLDKDTHDALVLLAAINHTSASQLLTNLIWKEADKTILENFPAVRI